MKVVVIMRDLPHVETIVSNKTDIGKDNCQEKAMSNPKTAEEWYKWATEQAHSYTQCGREPPGIRTMDRWRIRSMELFAAQAHNDAIKKCLMAFNPYLHTDAILSVSQVTELIGALLKEESP